MFCSIICADIEGISAVRVCVEADVTGGLPAFNMVGLLSSEVREAKERVVRAILNSGFDIPSRRITINISPASIRKSGTGFDLAIALAVLVCLGEVKAESVKDKMFIGELSLDGTINKINGILPMILMAKEEKIGCVVIPEKNVFEGAAIADVEISGAKTLRGLIDDLNKNTLPKSGHIDLEALLDSAYTETGIDYSDVRGQEKAKRATMLAVAGFHNLLYIGPPGSGKSMMAQRIPTILNRMSQEECLEISKIYSITGLLENDSLVLTRPYRAPHHSITPAALVGGNGNPRPGEVTLAHKGILFLDEAPEFKKDNIEMLRQPLEDKKIVISRARKQVIFPADFMLVMAMNPCRCGYYPDRNRCRCTQADVDRYSGKIRGPVLDRIDICVGVSKLELTDLSKRDNSISSQEMRECVLRAQEIQNIRFKGSKTDFNSQMTKEEMDMYCVLDHGAAEILNKAYENLNLSARGYYKVLKVSRTIADADGDEVISRKHVLEAVGYRNHNLDR